MGIPPARPFFPEKDREKIITEVRGCMESGWLTTYKYVERFEKAFAKYFGSKYAVAVNSGTAALHMALVCLGIKGEVIVPTNTFAATAHAAVYSGCRPVFADMDKETFNVSPESIKRVITEKTSAVMPVHVAGLPCEMDEIKEISEKHQLRVIEDAAHAHGAEYKGKKAGTIGDVGCFSFYPTKNMTSAEGGMIVTDRKDVAEKAKIIRDQGKESFYSNNIVEIGFNFRMTEICAILGYYQLKRLNQFLRTRSKIAKFYTDKLEGCVAVPEVPNYIRHSWYKYLITTKKPASEMMAKLKEKGIGTSQCYWPPLHLQPAYKKFAKGKFPVADSVLPRSFSLPLFNSMKMKDAKYTAEKLLEIL